ncbi:MAG: phosphoglycerate mutase family protein [Actinomycetes bacterium]
MTRIYLVRHGRASAGWDSDIDPGLDDLGCQQAEETAVILAHLSPMKLVSSPMLRCQQTAGFLSAKWDNAHVNVEPLVTEIPSPDGYELGERIEWLRKAMAGTWDELGPQYTGFRDQVVNFVATRDVDTVIFSHFIAINAVIGHCIKDDRLVIDSLDNASVTIVESDAGGNLRLVERGRQADTLIR